MTLSDGTVVESLGIEEIPQRVCFEAGPRIRKIEKIRVTRPNGAIIVSKVRFWYNEANSLIRIESVQERS